MRRGVCPGAGGAGACRHLGACFTRKRVQEMQAHALLSSKVHGRTEYVLRRCPPPSPPCAALPHPALPHPSLPQLHSHTTPTTDSRVLGFRVHICIAARRAHHKLSSRAHAAAGRPQRVRRIPRQCINRRCRLRCPRAAGKSRGAAALKSCRAPARPRAFPHRPARRSPCFPHRPRSCRDRSITCRGFWIPCGCWPTRMTLLVVAILT